MLIVCTISFLQVARWLLFFAEQYLVQFFLAVQDEVDLDALAAELVRMISEMIQLESVWLRLKDQQLFAPLRGSSIAVEFGVLWLILTAAISSTRD